MRHLPRLLVVVFLLTLFAFPLRPATAAPTSPASAAPFAYFPETGHNIAFQFKEFYDANGGTDLFGLPLTEAITDAATGLQVQYFERARFELHPNLPAGQQIVLTRLGSLMTQGRTDPAFAWLPGTSDPNRDFFVESGHTLGGAFRWFWQSRGGVAVFGFPISEEFLEYNPATGQHDLVQYFERTRLEYHPELTGTPHEVQISLLGRQLLERTPEALAATAPARAIVLLGEATTGYATSAREREFNIARATQLFDGMMIPANTDFSFNSVSDFEASDGFVDGYAIIGGRLETVVAGGLCQVSTTMFRAVSNAGLKITHRQGHTFIVYFYENILGFDATVFKPDVDFRWFNDTAGPVYLNSWSDPAAATVTFQIWGYSDGRTVTYDGPYERNWTQPGPAIWEYDPNLAPGAVIQLVHGRPGVDVNYYRTVTLPGGAVLHRDDFYTHYDPWEDYYVYGPGVR